MATASYIYNPAETINVCKHDGLEYAIPANQATKIVSRSKHATDAQVAAFIAKKLEDWGVCLVSAPVTKADGKAGKASNPEDQKLVDEAEKKYTATMTAWADGVVLEAHNANEPRVAAGLKPLPVTDELKLAKKYLGVR
jgi:hypothetical protein